MREKWRKWLRELVGVASAIGAVSSAGWGIWFIWGSYIKVLFAGVWHIRTHHVVWSGVATAAVAGIGYLATQRYGAADKNFYQLLAGKARHKKLKRRLGSLGSFLSGMDFNPRDFFYFNFSEHWLADKIEQWAARALRVLLWPLVIVNLVHLTQKGWFTAGGFLLTACGILLLFMLGGMKMRNLLLTALFVAWFGYIFSAEQGLQIDAHAAVVGACFLLWEVWHEWQRRIRQQPPPPESEPEPPANPTPETT